MVPQRPVLRIFSRQMDEAKYSPEKFLLCLAQIEVQRGEVIFEIIAYLTDSTGDSNNEGGGRLPG